MAGYLIVGALLGRLLSRTRGPAYIIREDAGGFKVIYVMDGGKEAEVKQKFTTREEAEAYVNPTYGSYNACCTNVIGISNVKAR